ncbi:glycosyltransferase family 87 protein [Novosphingobium huizhouense]|uniref:glycosyltransferase family 87 protein n=1 Tax=Novosphingobium huizhouense TaxID=2866625 RepID=UPI001CD8353B|nr:glycosyltransferase family 87 protein [Novosphingobium huizhouense]
MTSSSALPATAPPASGGPIAALRTLAFLDLPRVRAYGVMIALAYLPMLAKVYLEATGNVGSDFLAFWGAGKLVVAGTPARVYDILAEQTVQALSGTGQLVVFVNPPPYLFVAAPLGLLPYASAWVAWVVAGWSAWFLLCRRLLGEAPIAVFAFPGAYLAASHAQNGFLTALLLVGGCLALERRPWLAGALLGALIVKPHLALLVPLWLAAGRQWRAFAGAAASALGLCLASWLVFGTATWLAYPESFKASATLMADDTGPFFLRMATVYAGLRYHFDATTAFVGQAVVTIATAVLACRYWARAADARAAGAMLLAATALASPYLFSYDLAFLALPVFWLVGEARAQGWRPWEKLGIVALWLAPLATRAAALPLHLNLMPLASAALVWMIWRRAGPPPAPVVRP